MLYLASRGGLALDGRHSLALQLKNNFIKQRPNLGLCCNPD